MQSDDPTFGQIVIVSKSLDVRDQLKADLQAYLHKTFPGTDAFVKTLDIGPPVGRPIQYRISGPDIQKVRELAQKTAGIVMLHPSLTGLVFDWNEPARVVKIDVLQDKARQLGVSSEDIATALNGVVQGGTVTQVRDAVYLINVVAGTSKGTRLHRQPARPSVAERQR